MLGDSIKANPSELYQFEEPNDTRRNFLTLNICMREFNALGLVGTEVTFQAKLQWQTADDVNDLF